jgi:hypothetical protein
MDEMIETMTRRTYLISKGQNIVIEFTTWLTLTRKCLTCRHQQSKLGRFRFWPLFISRKCDTIYLVVDVLQIVEYNDEERTQKCAGTVERFPLRLASEKPVANLLICSRKS